MEIFIVCLLGGPLVFCEEWTEEHIRPWSARATITAADLNTGMKWPSNSTYTGLASQFPAYKMSLMSDLLLIRPPILATRLVLLISARAVAGSSAGSRQAFLTSRISR
jgi:hypothetical protein